MINCVFSKARHAQFDYVPARRALLITLWHSGFPAVTGRLLTPSGSNACQRTKIKLKTFLLGTVLSASHGVYLEGVFLGLQD